MITDIKWNRYFVVYVYEEEDEILLDFGRAKEGICADRLNDEEYEVFRVIEDILEQLDIEYAVDYSYSHTGDLEYEDIVSELSKCPLLTVKTRPISDFDGMTFTENGAICNSCRSNYRITRSSNGQLLFKCGGSILHMSHLISEKEYFNERKKRGFEIHPI